MANLDGQIAQL